MCQKLRDDKKSWTTEPSTIELQVEVAAMTTATRNAEPMSAARNVDAR